MAEGETKMQPSSTGCTIKISLESGNRNTLVSELNDGIEKWFNDNFNLD